MTFVGYELSPSTSLTTRTVPTRYPATCIAPVAAVGGDREPANLISCIFIFTFIVDYRP